MPVIDFQEEPETKTIDFQPIDFQEETAAPAPIKADVTTPDKGISLPPTLIRQFNEKDLPDSILVYKKDMAEAVSRGLIFNAPPSTAFNSREAFTQEIQRRNLGAVDQDAQNINRLAAILKGLPAGWEKERLQEELAYLRGIELSGESFKPNSLEYMRIKGIKIRQRELAQEEYGSDYAAWLAGQASYSTRQLLSQTIKSVEGIETGVAVGVSGGVVLGGAAGILPGAAAGVGAHVATKMLQYSYELESALAYDEFKEMIDEEGKPLDDNLARIGARTIGIVNTVIEGGSDIAILRLVPGFKQLKRAVGIDTAKKIAKDKIKAAIISPTMGRAFMEAAGKLLAAPTIEATEEFIQGLVSIGVEETAKAVSGQEFKPVPISERAKQLTEEMKAAFAGTFMTLGLPIAGAHIYSQSRQIRIANQSRQLFEELGDISKNSAINKEMPERYQEAIAELTKGGPIEKIYVPVEQWNKYWQEKEIDADVMTKVVSGNVIDKYIEIPTSVYASKLAATEHNNFFIDEMKFSPDNLSAREAKEVMANIPREAAQPQAKQTDDAVIEAAAGEITDEELDSIIEKNMPIDEEVIPAAEASPSAATPQEAEATSPPQPLPSEKAPQITPVFEESVTVQGQRMAPLLEKSPNDRIIVAKDKGGKEGKELGFFWYTKEPDGGFSGRKIESFAKRQGIATALTNEVVAKEGVIKGFTDVTPEGLAFFKAYAEKYPQNVSPELKQRLTELTAKRGTEFKLAPTEMPAEKAKPAVQEDLIKVQPEMPKTAIATEEAGHPMLEEITKSEEEKRQLAISEQPVKIIKEKKPVRPNPESDSLAAYVRKQGGLNYEKEAMKGELDRLSKKEAGTTGLLSKSGKGYTLDQMLEKAIEDGYFNENATINDLLGALENEVYMNKKHYSTMKVWSDKELGEMMVAGMILESKKDYGKILTDNHKEYANDKENLAIAEKAIKSTRQLELYSLPETQRDVLDERSGKPLEKGGIKTHAIGITPELIRKGYINLQGQEVKTPKQVAILAQVFRNPQYETLRIIYAKDNKVVGHEGITSNLPGTVSVFNAKDYRKEIHEFKDRLKRLGADSVWLVHNHPSGNALPSANDLNMTARFSDILPVKGHVVIDSQEYSFIPADGSEGTVYPLKTDDAILKPSLSHELIGAYSKNPAMIAKIAAKIKTGDYITALYVSSNLNVRGIQEIPYGMLKNPKALTDYLRGRAREFGTPFVQLAGKQLEGTNKSDIKTLIENGVILDYVVFDDVSISLSYRDTIILGMPPSGWLGSIVKKYNVAEETKKYGESEKLADVVKKETGQIKDEELVNLRYAFKKAARAARDAYRAGNKEGVEVEKQKLRNILDRSKKLRAVRDYFGLTDAEMKKISRRNPLLMSTYEFKVYLDDIRQKALELAENSFEKSRIMYLIFNKDLKKVDNYRMALGLPPITKMTTEQAEQFANLLEPFHEGDTFLTLRELETVDRTDLAGIRTWREAKERLAKETGVRVEELNKIKVTEFDKYRWDASLMDRNPFYKMMVTEATRKLLEGNLRIYDIENKVFELARKSNKSRKRSLLERAIPQDKQIMEYLEAPMENKEAIGREMTPEQLDYANFIQTYFKNALEYLIKENALEKGRENYFVHVRRSFLENAKEAGIIDAVKGIFKSYQDDMVVFQILDKDTGNILPLEKFFQFALHRSGAMEPSANITKAFLTYAKTFEKKVSLDEIIPKIDIYAQSLTPQKLTPRGLEKDRSIKTFVNEYINNKKGRRIDQMVGKQGGIIDVGIRAAKTFTTLLDLGFNIPVGLTSYVGESITNFIQLGIKKHALGGIRNKTKKGKAIVKKYEAYTDRSIWENFKAPGKEIQERFSDAMFGLFHQSMVDANKHFLLGSLTKEEWNSGEISSKRLAEMQLEMGRWRVVPGTKSLVGSTAIGSAAMQYKTWAAPIIRTTIKDAATLAADLKNKPVNEALTTREAREIYRIIGITTTVLIVGAMAGADKEDKSFVGQLLAKAYRESLTLLQGVDPSLWLATPRIMGFLTELGKNLHAIILLEEYKTKKGYKGVEGLKRQFIPRAIKQFKEPEKKQKK